MPPRIAVQKFVEGWRNLRQTPQFVEGFAFDKPLSSKFVEKKFVEGSLTIIVSSLSTALGSDGQGPQGLSFDFLDFLLICLIFYLSFLFWELDQQRTSRAPSSRASVRNIRFEVELNL